jgi:hypothetical protein
MPLAIYRRHSTGCKFYGRPRRDSRSQNCTCPVWVQGSLGQEYLRRSLDLTSWQAAQDLVRGWETSGEVGVINAEIPGIADAVERFFDDIKARGSVRGNDQQAERPAPQAVPYLVSIARLPRAQAARCRRAHAVPHDVEGESDFERQEAGAVERILPLLRRPRLDSDEPSHGDQTGQGATIADAPIRRESIATILDACDRYPIKGIYNHGNRQRMRTLTLLLRCSGLHIRDAVTCARERLVGSKLFLYQAKTGTAVYCPLPPLGVDALKETKGPNPKYFFWTGTGIRRPLSPMRSGPSERSSSSPASRDTRTCSAIRLPSSS